jgi:hypothetical protein
MHAEADFMGSSSQGGIPMADIIHALFCNPPIAIARLGSSTAPLVAYSWVLHGNPRNDDPAASSLGAA